MNASKTPRPTPNEGNNSSPGTGLDRPLTHRLIHSVIEALLALALAGGLLFGLTTKMCQVKYRCDDLGGLPYAMLSLAIAIAISCGYLALCRKYRNRVSTRRDLDACVALLTFGLWAWILFAS